MQMFRWFPYHPIQMYMYIPKVGPNYRELANQGCIFITHIFDLANQFYTQSKLYFYCLMTYGMVMFRHCWWQIISSLILLNFWYKRWNTLIYVCASFFFYRYFCFLHKRSYLLSFYFWLFLLLIIQVTCLSFFSFFYIRFEF